MPTLSRHGRRARARPARLALGLAALCGCATSAQSRGYERLSAELARVPSPAAKESDRELRALLAAPQLERAAFVRAVLARNPNLEAARQGWREALVQYRQATALDDPMAEYAIAPLSIGSDVPFGHSVSLSQRFLWPGKLSLKGQVALAEAEAAREDYQAARLRLALMAAMLFDEYYAVHRSRAINEQHRALIEDIRSAAEAQYEAGRAAQQDALQAEVELAHVLRRGIALEAQRKIAIAQMNGLLHRRPDAALPPPPETRDLAEGALASSERLQREALERRPELRATQARARAQESRIELAEREYYPDLGVMASYSTMWMDPEHRFMLGVSMNLPLQLGARAAAVEQAEAQLGRTRAELAAAADEIRVEVQRARERVIEAQEVVRLYEERLLPSARAQIEAARAGYEVGRSSFQALIDAERSLRTFELDHQAALAELGQRGAELERTLGRVPGLPGGAPGEGSSEP